MYNEENSEYLLKNKNWHIEDSLWKAGNISNIIQKHKLAIETIVEIGCGAGEILVQLQKSLNTNNLCYYGYDIAPDVVPFWKNRENEKLQFYNKNLLTENLYYDLLLMIDVFEHVDDYRGFISKSSTLAKHKIFHIPLDINVLGIIRNTPIKVKKLFGHIHYFTKETALATLEDCGLQIIDYKYTGSSVDLNNDGILNNLMKYLRKLVFFLNKDFAVRLLGGYSLLVLAK